MTKFLIMLFIMQLSEIILWSYSIILINIYIQSSLSVVTNALVFRSCKSSSWQWVFLGCNSRYDDSPTAHMKPFYRIECRSYREFLGVRGCWKETVRNHGLKRTRKEQNFLQTFTSLGILRLLYFHFLFNSYINFH